VSKNYFKFGDFNRICDWSGFKVKASRTQETWDHNIVRFIDWDPRHPQEFLRGVPDLMDAPNARPEAADVFTGVLYDNTSYITQESPNQFIPITQEKQGFFILLELDQFAGPQV